MKSLPMVILGIVLGVVAIAIRLLGLVPSGLGNSRRSNPVGNRFLLGVGVVCLAIIFSMVLVRDEGTVEPQPTEPRQVPTSPISAFIRH